MPGKKKNPLPHLKIKNTTARPTIRAWQLCFKQHYQRVSLDSRATVRHERSSITQRASPQDLPLEQVPAMVPKSVQAGPDMVTCTTVLLTCVQQTTFSQVLHTQLKIWHSDYTAKLNHGFGE